MFKKVLGFILLPSMLLSIAPLSSIKSNVEVSEYEATNNNINTKSENSNNHEMVFYNSADAWAGDYVSWGAELSEGAYEYENNDYVTLSGSYSTIVNLKDGYDFDDFDNVIYYTYLTLYDVTNGENNSIGTLTLTKDSDFYIHAPVYATGTNYNAASFRVNTMWWIEEFGATLEEYHDYRIGFNINKGDDLKVYSNIFHKEVPELTQFDVTSSDDSLTIDYTVAEPQDNQNVFDYNELYFKVDNKRYDLDETSGQVVINNLRPAKEYDVVFGYDVDKVVSGQIVTPLAKETTYSASTTVPGNYSFEEGIIVSFVLLIILLIIFLILILMIVYWNHQRRKISGMALVVGEDTESYDPVYQYNYYQQEDEAGVPNASSSNQGDEVYGYFDEVQDEYYQDEEIAGYFDEVQEDYYEDEEIAGYFDEVQEDYYEDDVYDIDHLDEGEWF